MSKYIPSISAILHFPQIRLSNVNFIGAVIFTTGCSVLVVNAILSFLPYAGAGFQLPPQIVYVESWLSIASNLFFLAGSGFAFVQILNAKKAELYAESQMSASEEDFGLNASKPVPSVTYVESAATSTEDLMKESNESVSKDESEHPSIPVIYYDETPAEEVTPVWPDPLVEHNNNNWLSAGSLAPVMGIYAMTPTSSTENLVPNTQIDTTNEKDLESQTPDPSSASPNHVPEELWRYIPSSHEMWVRSIHEIGFLATTIFFCSSLTYFSASIASIVTIMQTGEISRWIRYPQLIAAVGFAVASTILMLQAQEKWYLPAYRRVRWWVNLMNLVGSFGFIICACFGLVEGVEWARYQFGMSYLWGSWAFLFGSVMQWYKSLHKRAVARRNEWVDDAFNGEKDLMF